jgi:hypothetical protein
VLVVGSKLVVIFLSVFANFAATIVAVTSIFTLLTCDGENVNLILNYNALRCHTLVVSFLFLNFFATFMQELRPQYFITRPQAKLFLRNENKFYRRDF